MFQYASPAGAKTALKGETGVEFESLGENAIAGLELEGYIVESDADAAPETKVIDSAPETSEPVAGVDISPLIPPEKRDAHEAPDADGEAPDADGEALAALGLPATGEEKFPPFVEPDEVVEIPKDWESMHYKHRIQLAKKFHPDMEIDSEKANELIQAVVDNRKSFTG